MPRSVRFHPAAADETAAAAEWYTERSARAAGRFLDELDHLLERIAEAPHSFPVFDGDLRRAVFRRFPFYVVFRADDSNVVVFAVAHARRRPGYWRDRA